MAVRLDPFRTIVNVHWRTPATTTEPSTPRSSTEPVFTARFQTWITADQDLMSETFGTDQFHPWGVMALTGVGPVLLLPHAGKPNGTITIIDGDQNGGNSEGFDVAHYLVTDSMPIAFPFGDPLPTGTTVVLAGSPPYRFYEGPEGTL